MKKERNISKSNRQVSKINSRRFQEKLRNRSGNQTTIAFAFLCEVTFSFVFAVTFLRPRPDTIISGTYVYARACLPPAGNYSVRASRICSRYVPCMCAGRVCRQRTLERHSVVTTFVIRPSASYWRILFYLNIFSARNSPRTGRVNQSYFQL